MNDKMIYIHFPFCRKKCLYCDFYSVTDTSLMEKYIKRLCEDIRLFSGKHGNFPVSSIYVGGGTPSIMTKENVISVFDEIFSCFSVSSHCEITFEMNPESVDEKILSALKSVGVTRISMGVQSQIDSELLKIGRIHNSFGVEKAIEKIKKHGFENFNCDLIYALPGQNMDSWRYNLEKTVSYNPKHISFYALTLSEKVPLFSKISEIPDDEIQREMYLFAVEYLEKNGYYQYEISNAAKPGFESRHNLGYWQGKDYAGFGTGAHSYIDGQRYFVKSDVKKYTEELDREKLIEKCETLTLEDEYTEYIFLNLRTQYGIDLQKIEERFGREKRELNEKILGELSLRNLSKKTENGYRLTAEGFFVSDSIVNKLI